MSNENARIEKLIEDVIREISEIPYDFLVDAHCHIESDTYTENEREEIVSRAIAHRILMFSTPLTMKEREYALRLKKKFAPWIMIVTGSHPLLNEPIDQVIRWIYEHQQELIGIGEIGLDFTPPYNQPDIVKKQMEKFEKFINIGKELDLPLVIHSRAAGRYAIDVLINNGAERVLMHAFSGKAKYALRGVDAGYYFSIPPSVAFSPQKKKLVKVLPLDNMLLETDSPLFSPIRGKKGEPIYVMFTAAIISTIKEIDIKEVLKTTTKNAQKLFRIPLPSF